MKARLDMARARFDQWEIDGLMVASDENRRYLSGFTGTAGSLIISASDQVLATDFRYVEQAGRQAPDFRVVRVMGGADWLAETLKEMGVQRLGFESQHVTVATHERLSKALGESNGGAAVPWSPPRGWWRTSAL